MLFGNKTGKVVGFGSQWWLSILRSGVRGSMSAMNRLISVEIYMALAQCSESDWRFLGNGTLRA